MLVWLLTRLLEQDADGSSIMTPLYVRSAIDVRVWQEHIPIDLRVQVDGRRLRKELEGKSFTCRDELAVVKLERVVQHIPLEHICGVFDALERVLPGLVEAVDPDDDGESTETAQRSRSRVAGSRVACREALRLIRQRRQVVPRVHRTARVPPAPESPGGGSRR